MREQEMSAADDPETANTKPFTGTPTQYRRIAVWGSIGLHAYLFVGFWAIKTFFAGEVFPNGWIVPVATVVSTLWFARFSYRWTMRLDAQYGTGSGWLLESVQVKLPRERSRRKGQP